MSEMMDRTKNLVQCSACSQMVPQGMFCMNCGSLLKSEQNSPMPSQLMSGMPMAAAFGLQEADAMDAVSLLAQAKKEEQHPETEASSDEGLYMLVSCCRKRVATVGGDGYTEYVLYLNRKTDEYTVHFYAKYQPSVKEKHRAYKADESLKNQIYDILEKENMASLRDVKGFGLMGGDAILKWMNGDAVICLDSSNLYGKGMEVYARIEELILSFVKEENALN